MNTCESFIRLELNRRATFFCPLTHDHSLLYNSASYELRETEMRKVLDTMKVAWKKREADWQVTKPRVTLRIVTISHCHNTAVSRCFFRDKLLLLLCLLSLKVSASWFSTVMHTVSSQPFHTYKLLGSYY